MRHLTLFALIALVLSSCGTKPRTDSVSETNSFAPMKFKRVNLLNEINWSQVSEINLVKVSADSGDVIRYQLIRSAEDGFNFVKHVIASDNIDKPASTQSSVLAQRLKCSLHAERAVVQCGVNNLASRGKSIELTLSPYDRATYKIKLQIDSFSPSQQQVISEEQLSDDELEFVVR